MRNGQPSHLAQCRRIALPVRWCGVLLGCAAVLTHIAVNLPKVRVVHWHGGVAHSHADGAVAHEHEHSHETARGARKDFSLREYVRDHSHHTHSNDGAHDHDHGAPHSHATPPREAPKAPAPETPEPRDHGQPGYYCALHAAFLLDATPSSLTVVALAPFALPYDDPLFLAHHSGPSRIRGPPFHPFLSDITSA